MMKRGARSGAESPALFLSCCVPYPHTSYALASAYLRGKKESEKIFLNPIDKAK